ncbi:MAG: hypothetical protein WDO16_08730 [Bacteroidota bacterium]
MKRLLLTGIILPRLCLILYGDRWKNTFAVLLKYILPLQGGLFRISFGALYMDDKRVLSDKYKLVQLTTTASVTDQLSDYINSDDKVQLYGGIIYDADTAALKEAVSAYHNKAKIQRPVPDDLTRGKSFRYLPVQKKKRKR